MSVRKDKHRRKLEINSMIKSIEEELKYLNETMLEYTDPARDEGADIMELSRIRTFLRTINRRDA